MRSLKELRQVCERVMATTQGGASIPRPELRAFYDKVTPTVVLSLLDQLEAAQLTWTAEKPTKGGWYWWRVCEYDKTTYSLHPHSRRVQ